MTRLKNIHPGEILSSEFLSPMKISQNQIARDIGVSPRRINEIIHGKRSVTADSSLRLAKYFGLSDDFFLGLQKNYELEESRIKISREISSIESYSRTPNSP